MMVKILPHMLFWLLVETIARAMLARSASRIATVLAGLTEVSSGCHMTGSVALASNKAARGS